MSQKYIKIKVKWREYFSVIDSRAASIVRYGAGSIIWIKMKLQELDRKTRKLTATYGAQHPTAHIDRLNFAEM